MEIVQIVLDKKLLRAADEAARRTKRNRSALVRDALREHLRRLAIRVLPDRGLLIAAGARGEHHAPVRSGSAWCDGRLHLLRATAFCRGRSALFPYVESTPQCSPQARKAAKRAGSHGNPSCPKNRELQNELDSVE